MISLCVGDVKSGPPRSFAGLALSNPREFHAFQIQVHFFDSFLAFALAEAFAFDRGHLVVGTRDR